MQPSQQAAEDEIDLGPNEATRLLPKLRAKFRRLLEAPEGTITHGAKAAQMERWGNPTNHGNKEGKLQLGGGPTRDATQGNKLHPNAPPESAEQAKDGNEAARSQLDRAPD